MKTTWRRGPVCWSVVPGGGAGAASPGSSVAEWPLTPIKDGQQGDGWRRADGLHLPDSHWPLLSASCALPRPGGIAVAPHVQPSLLFPPPRLPSSLQPGAPADLPRPCTVSPLGRDERPAGDLPLGGAGHASDLDVSGRHSDPGPGRPRPGAQRSAVTVVHRSDRQRASSRSPSPSAQSGAGLAPSHS